MKHSICCVCSSMLVFAAQPAAAYCTIGSGELVNFHLARSLGTVLDDHRQRFTDLQYHLLAEDGWDGPHREKQVSSYELATFLAREAVLGPPPPVRQRPDGVYEYDPDALLAPGPFHRSWDGYGPLVLDVEEPRVYLNWRNGQPTQDYGVWMIPVGMATIGAGVPLEFYGPVNWNTPMDDMGGAAAQTLEPFESAFDPDYEIRFACEAFAGDAVALASIIVHEQWHTTGSHHLTLAELSGNPYGSCLTNPAFSTCDNFVWGAPDSSRQFGGIMAQSAAGVGAYQMQSQFLCDLTEHGAGGLPYAVRLAAQENFDARASQSRYNNLDPNGPDGNFFSPDSGRLPYTCGTPASILRVPADGTFNCPGTTALRCDNDGMCDDGIALTFDSCVQGCCESVVIK